VSREWLLCVTAEDERIAERPAFTGAAAACLAGAIFCVARLIVAWKRGEAFGTDTDLAAVLLAAIAMGGVAALRSVRSGPGRRRGGSDGRRRARMRVARREKTWQAGFPMHARHGFPYDVHRPARGRSVALAGSKFSQDFVKIAGPALPNLSAER
jgi:hypothetical protein